MKMERLPKGEEGSIFVWSAVGLAVLIAFAGFATDVPYVYVARQQAQTAADAGAIAGAYELPGGDSARSRAKTFAGKTPIIGTLLTAPQIDAFTCNSNGGAIGECAANSANPDQITCITYRDVAHGNAMPLFVLPILQFFGLGSATATSSGWDAANVSATATARKVSTCSSECFKPWSITDKWTDVNGNGKFDNGVDLYGPVTTGYQWPRDNGLQVTLKLGGNNITPSFFYAVDFPPQNRGTPDTGGSVYRNNIATCGNGSFVAIGDRLQQEPGNMVGPTKQGVEDLIALDPTASWDTGCNCVNSPEGASSPRMIRIAFFDPGYPVESGRNYVTVIKVGGFFLEGVASNGDVTGRYTQVIAYGGPANPACAGLQVVQLVK
jgi:hypothetical protein